jgi:competence protein ComGF
MKKISAFTILETTIVLAIMSILITILMLATNRFNAQLKKTVEIQQELNTFFAFRANLWQELYTSDSMAYHHETCFIYQKKRTIAYRIMEDKLFRKVAKEWISTGFYMRALQKEIKKEETYFRFIFDWKGESMCLTHLFRTGIQQKINHYFTDFTR